MKNMYNFTKSAGDGYDDSPAAPPGISGGKKEEPAKPKPPVAKQQPIAAKPTPVKEAPASNVKKMQELILQAKSALQTSEIFSLSSKDTGRGQYNYVDKPVTEQHIEQVFREFRLPANIPTIQSILETLNKPNVPNQVLNNVLTNKIPNVSKWSQEQIESLVVALKAPLGDTTSKQEEELYGTRPVGDFILSNYMTDTHHKPTQFVNVDQPEKQRLDPNAGASELSSLKGIIDTIGRIGTPQEDPKKQQPNKQQSYVGSIDKERNVDGIWDIRTNNALKAISAVTEALVKFANDLGYSDEFMERKLGFSQKYMEAFNQFIPDDADFLKPEKKEKTADAICKYLKVGIIPFFTNFSKSVVGNDKIKNILNQTKSFVKVPTRGATQQQDKGPDLSSEENKQAYNSFVKSNYDIIQIPNLIQGKVSGIKADALSSYTNFKAFLSKELGHEATDSDVKYTFERLKQYFANISPAKYKEYFGTQQGAQTPVNDPSLPVNITPSYRIGPYGTRVPTK